MTNVCLQYPPTPAGGARGRRSVAGQHVNCDTFRLTNSAPALYSLHISTLFTSRHSWHLYFFLFATLSVQRRLQISLFHKSSSVCVCVCNIWTDVKLLPFDTVHKCRGPEASQQDSGQRRHLLRSVKSFWDARMTYLLSVFLFSLKWHGAKPRTPIPIFSQSSPVLFSTSGSSYCMVPAIWVHRFISFICIGALIWSLSWCTDTTRLW